MNRTLMLVLVLAYFASGAISSAVAEERLTARECMLLFNSDSKPSRALAENYASMRGVPSEQIVGLSFPLRESLSRREYEDVSREIREILNERSWGSHIRCIVTFYDVPLKVKAPIVGEAHKKRLAEFKEHRREAGRRLETLLDKMDPKSGVEQQDQPPASDANAIYAALITRYQRARSRLAAESEKAVGESRNRLGMKLLEYVELAEGRAVANALVMRMVSNLPPEKARRLEMVERESADYHRLIEKIGREGPTSDRAIDVLDTVRVWRGLLGLCHWLDDQIRWCQSIDCHSSFDSELCLVLRESYPVYRWHKSDLFFSGHGLQDGAQDAGEPRTLMVARIDAPSPEVAMRMVSDAIAVEKDGLQGRFYIDLRGLKGRDLYAAYDRNLYDLFDMMRENTDLEVILDSSPSVFPPGSCPDAGLYCGWYSVGNYVPAFTFNRGAVALHIASFECVSLRDVEKNYWCPGLLKDGVAVTMGPTSEPYLHTFPIPTVFFPLLLTGEPTLAECFYEANPFVSWQMTLLGDPLYRPFASNPKLSMAEAKRIMTKPDAEGTPSK